MKVTIEKLRKSYGKRQVLTIDKLEFNAGELTALWGPNGVGKSTLLKIIAGLDFEYEGTVLYDGKPFDDEIKKDITLVFQKPYMLNTTVQKNIMYPLKLRGQNTKECLKKTLDIAQKLGIEQLLSRRATQLSGGETQKVALARSMVFEPKLLILDEATAGVDIHTISKIEEALVDFNREKNATIIFSTHNKEQAKRLSQSVTELFDGREGYNIDFL
jgi:tungstate transport system ATP-binding protein